MQAASAATAADFPLPLPFPPRVALQNDYMEQQPCVFSHVAKWALWFLSLFQLSSLYTERESHRQTHSDTHGQRDERTHTHKHTWSGHTLITFIYTGRSIKLTQHDSGQRLSNLRHSVGDGGREKTKIRERERRKALRKKCWKVKEV